MNGAHDLGGMHGFGRVEVEPNEPKFHAAWERDAFALTLAASLHGRWNLDMTRFARENRPPAEYLSLPYYGLWLAGLERLAAGAGMLDGSGRFAAAPTAAAMREKFAAGAPVQRRAGPVPAFVTGDQVRVLPMSVAGHTRCPRYCRGASGTIAACRGNHVFPDSHAHGAGEDPRPLYTVRFDAALLFGAGAEPNSSVMIDLWEPYLARA
ncbi:MAG: nitrile hydratase subunit beta [Acetobacteraceae bacterium]|nr:nitrile hydratase subunit beta [Acetobacteraceae bacterium]